MAQFALRHFVEAERGFRRALELTPDLTDAAVNFGAMLGSQGRWKEAAVLLEGALPNLEAEGRAAVGALAEQCRTQMGAAKPGSGPS
jgi:Tfp pilus assembly protein PilF